MSYPSSSYYSDLSSSKDSYPLFIIAGFGGIYTLGFGGIYARVLI